MSGLAVVVLVHRVWPCPAGEGCALTAVVRLRDMGLYVGGMDGGQLGGRGGWCFIKNRNK